MKILRCEIPQNIKINLRFHQLVQLGAEVFEWALPAERIDELLPSNCNPPKSKVEDDSILKDYIVKVA